ncbi:hypothetical protein N9N28_05660 [Rubripirellula amarantea]|nr:hypothetical protein [Rubripirellula amarantea]
MNPNKVTAIRSSGLTIYDSLDDRPELFFDLDELEQTLIAALLGTTLDFPLRTRSKVAKQRVCKALGYPVPSSFQRTRPRFPGQELDVFVQKSNNVQIWNDGITPTRRYALIRVDDRERVTGVRVINGEALSRLDRSDTLTHKYQATSQDPIVRSTLVSPTDTGPVISKIVSANHREQGNSVPFFADFKPIADVFESLSQLIGVRIDNPGADQERNRGAGLHVAIAHCLASDELTDNGQFPDIASQLLEIKLQTATTVDLGAVHPNSEEILVGYPAAKRLGIRHCDVRYAILYGSIDDEEVIIEHLVLTTGQDFFKFFQQFGGLEKNSKNQITLPGDFWD